VLHRRQELALLGAGARSLLLPSIDLGLCIDGGWCRSARRYGQRKMGSGASPVRPQGHRAGGGLERRRRGLLLSSSPRPAVPMRPSFLELFLPNGIGFGELPMCTSKISVSQSGYFDRTDVLECFWFYSASSFFTITSDSVFWFYFGSWS
jgi:hypothetical protein